jgi:hypothetical protein
MGMTPEEKIIYDKIVGQTAPTGKVRAQDAKKALESDEWKKWLKEREHDSAKGVVPIHGFNADGQAVKAEKYNDRLVICWMYDTYLRMAQMNQRSAYTMAADRETGRLLGKLIIEMTFDEFLVDGIKNLDWVRDEDIPMKRKFYTESPIGVIYGLTAEEAKFSLELNKRLRESIQNYLKMDEKEKLIYATDAVLFE